MMKKLHPQELLVSGDQSNAPVSKFRTNVTGRYDRYPFGMEILERSLSSSSVNGIQSTSNVLYNGLLFSCSDYNVSNGVEKDCETDVNVNYGNTFVSSMLAISEEDDIEIEAKLKLSKVLPNLDPLAVYRIELMTINSSGRPLNASLGDRNGYIISSSAGNGASQAQITAASDKLVSFELTGAQLQSEANLLGIVDIVLVSETGSGFYSTEIEIEYIKVMQLFKNTSIPLAKRNTAAYRYGFQGQELDNEWAGVAYGGGDIPLWEDAVQSKGDL